MAPSSHAAETPPQAQKILDESPLEPDDLLNITFLDVWQTLEDHLPIALGEPLAFAARAAGYLLLACAVGLAAGKSSWKNCVDAVAVLGFGVLSLSAMTALLKGVGQTAADSQAYLSGFVPVYAGVLALSGQTAGAAVYSGMFLTTSAFLSTAIETLLLPVMQIYFCFSVSAALWGNPGVEAAAALFGRCLTWLLKGCGALFSMLLGMQGLLAGNTDSAAIKLGQSVLSGAIPVVGDAAAAALSGTLSALRLLKGSLAVAAVAALTLTFLPVFARCALYVLAFYGAGVVASGSGQKQCGQICSLFAEGARLCASVLILYYFMVVLSTILMLVTGNGG